VVKLDARIDLAAVEPQAFELGALFAVECRVCR
jgi:hypothetical protein